MEALRKRAASLLTARGLQVEKVESNHASDQNPMKEKHNIPEIYGNNDNNEKNIPAQGQATSSNSLHPLEKQSGFSHHPVRITPPWIDDENDENEDEDDPNPSSQLLPEKPALLHPAQHNHTPTPFHPSGFITRHRNEPGRRHDARRGAEPPTPRHHPREMASRWKQFAEETEYPRDPEEQRQLVNEEYMVENEPDFLSNSWHDAGHDNIKFHAWRAKKRTAWNRAQRTVLRSAFIPLVFRLIVFSFCLMALGLGWTVYKTLVALDSPLSQQLCQMDYRTSTTSPLMAVVIDAAAIAYIFYITWDEYKGLPLGLRSGKAKISVLLFDLLFIVFSSANVTIAFESVLRYDNACQAVESMKDTKWQQEYLASTLLVALIAWLMTFAVSVLRVVEKVEQT